MSITSSACVYVAEARSGSLWEGKGNPFETSSDKVTARLAFVNALKPSRKGEKVTGGVQWGCTSFRHDHSLYARSTGYKTTTSALLAAVDQRGHIYVFDLEANKYNLIARTGIAGTAVAIGIAKPNELLVGLSDRSVHCYNIDTGAPIAKLTSHHDNIVTRISLHPTRPHALTSSTSETVLWDTAEWVRRHVLTGVDSVGVHQTEFSPSGDLIIASFRDDTLVIWDSESLEEIWKVSASNLTGFNTGAMGGIGCFSLSSDGKLLAAGGWGIIYVWTVKDQRLHREIIDERLQSGILQLEFASRTTLLFALNDQGKIIIFDANSDFSKSVGLKAAKSYSISSDGMILSTTPIHSPSFIATWSVESLLRAESPQEDEPGLVRGNSRRGSNNSSPAGSIRRGNNTPTRSGRSDDRRLSGASVRSRTEEKRLSNSSLTGPRSSPKPVRSNSVTATSGARSRLSGPPAIPRNLVSGQARTRTSMEPSTSVRQQLGRDAYGERRMSDSPYRATGASSPSRSRTPGSGAVRPRESLNTSPTPTDASNEANQSVLDSGIDLSQNSDQEVTIEKLNEVLLRRGRFPRSSRTMIWRFLLRLPQNHDEFRYLIAKGSHPCIDQFRERFAMQNRKLQLAMERMVSLLVHWHAGFEELDYLPYLVFPFVKMMGDDLLACFELVATVLFNWCQGWWERFPGPPKGYLERLDELLWEHDPELAEHFQQRHISVDIYGWVPIQALFSEVLCKEDWARLWDHCFTLQPSFIYFFCVALLIGCRETLLGLGTANDVEDLLRQPQAVNLLDLIDLAKRIESATPANSSPFVYHAPFKPISTGEYPTLGRVGARRSSRLRSDILKEEVELLRSRLSAM